MSVDYKPTQLERLEADERGVLHDPQGNPVSGRMDYSANAVNTIASGGRPLTNAEVYRGYYDNAGRLSRTRYGLRYEGYGADMHPVKYADAYPGPLNVHQNVPLTNFAVSFEVDSGLFIGPVLAPIHTVEHRSDIFYKTNTTTGEDLVRDIGNAATRGVGAIARDYQFQFDTDTYQVETYALRDFLPDELAQNADEALMLQQRITTGLQTVLEYEYVRRLIDDQFTTGNLTDDTVTNLGGGQLGSATEANRYVQRTINAVRLAMIRANLMKGPTHMVMNADVAQTAARSTEIITTARHQIGDTYIINGGWAGQNFGLPNQLYGVNVVVMPHVQNTAVKNATPSFSDMLTDNIIFLHVDAPGRKTMNACTTFRVGGLTVRTYRDDAREGMFIEVKMVQDEKLTNTPGAYLATDALA